MGSKIEVPQVRIIQQTPNRNKVYKYGFKDVIVSANTIIQKSVRLQKASHHLG
jgi:hypothetical protein